MTLSIPYTFQAGTKAKANEVNENFLAVKQFVDTLESNEAQLELDVDALENSKADINGDNSQRFQVADAVNTKDAINKDTLFNYIAPTQSTVNGFILSKYDDYTISATPGSCWDSTNVFVLKSATSLTVEEQGLSADAKYYVYVAGGGTANTQLVISVSSTTPSLPVGALYFRRLGSFSTDEDGNIDADSVNNDTATGIPNAKAVIIKTYVNGTSGYIIYSNGYCEQWGCLKNVSGSVSVTFLKIFKDTNYNLSGSHQANNGGDPGKWIETAITYENPTTTGFNTWFFNTASPVAKWWKASGYLAQGEY